jgi:methylthioribose-1-phosphate isomerase
LNSARRCVIDVSDSEDDTSEDETPSGRASVPRETLSSARDSALALELEIERMRKVIREREEMKLRKQAAGGIGTWERRACVEMGGACLRACIPCCIEANDVIVCDVQSTEYKDIIILPISEI